MIVLIAFIAPATELNDNILFQAAADELQRNINKLRIEKQAEPYYVAYRIQDTRSIYMAATFGGLLYNTSDHVRDAYVTVRVGSYELDNSNFMCQTRSSSIKSDYTTLPLDDDYDAIRDALWLVTDGTYKKALEIFSRKKAVLQNQPAKKEGIPDFSKGVISTNLQPQIDQHIDESTWKTRIIALSKVFQSFPKIQESEVSFSSEVTHQYFLDSEGNKSCTPRLVTSVEVSAKTQSDDGESLEQNFGFYGQTSSDLPDQTTMVKRVTAMAETLSLLTSLEKEEEYSGPVLFIGQAAAELFFQILGKGVSAPKAPMFENEMLSQREKGSNMGILTNRFGRRVMTDFLSAFDDPTLKEWKGTSLIGHFMIDDEGVTAERADIVQDGKLASVLMSRAPIKKVRASNGHGRYCSESSGARVCGMVANLVVLGEPKKTRDELKKLLIDMCTDFDITHGLLITQLAATKPLTTKERYMRYFSSSGGDEPLLSHPVIAYKVDAEKGTVTLIRGLDFSSVTPRALRDIIAIGDDEYVYNFIYRDDNNNEYPMSVIAPAVLIEEMDLVSRDSKPKKLPILKHPYF
jgi:predicted Zn-dependent protease